MNAVTPQTLRSDAENILNVWGEWADQDVMELAEDAAAALRKLAARIENNRPCLVCLEPDCRGGCIS